MNGCVWYVSGFGQPWEADVIANLADALKSRGAAPRVYSSGGTALFHSDTVMSWKSLTFFERLKTVLGRRKLWHLWGDAPLWWGLVRLRSRTVHTSLAASPRWRGHPTRLFGAQARGENRVLPTFEPKASWADSDGGPDDELILAWPDKTGTVASVVTEVWSSLSGERKLSNGKAANKIFVTSAEPPDALHAAYVTMRGVPVVARDTPLIREILGPDGYIAAPGQDAGDWRQVLRTAADTGRSVSAAARRFLKDHYSASAAAESLVNLYDAVSKGRV